MQVRRKENAEWETIELHRNIFAIVCISLQVSSLAQHHQIFVC